MTHDTAKGDLAAAEISRRTSNPLVSSIQLDLSSFASVTAAASMLLTATGQIDVIMCNAGISTSDVAGLPVRTEDGFDRVFEVNLLGHVLLIDQLMPLLRRSRGRVVHVSSKASFFGCRMAGEPEGCLEIDRLKRIASHSPTGTILQGIGTGVDLPASNYGITKYLQVWHAAEFARRHPGIRAFSLHPGIIRTKLVGDLLPANVTWCAPPRPCPVSASQGASTQTFLAAATDNELAQANGQYFELCGVHASVISQRVASEGRDAALAYQSRVYDLLVELAHAASR
mmetsp:Transcript_42352/g.111492  ORF Transcript_42352/g.111492 Transcript_42352/m.111492 type:complete len:285 (-) Transcript_42352:175-1029(-)